MRCGGCATFCANIKPLLVLVHCLQYTLFFVLCKNEFDCFELEEIMQHKHVILCNFNLNLKQLVSYVNSYVKNDD